MFERNGAALFIDGANVYATCKALGFDIDYDKLPGVLKKLGYTVGRKFYFTAIKDKLREQDPLRPLLDWLQYNGYHVMSKPVKEFVDASGVTKIKGNMDMEIAVEVYKMSKVYRQMIFMTGDGDFACLVKAMQDEGVNCTVISSLLKERVDRRTGRPYNPMVADELRRQTDKFIDLEELIPVLVRD